ncbi:hypothetical protein PPS11_06100 [Pseudomonas putida S11]|nr:hypothetical protein PPS11_06100 [Pseudomonas putida S11]
MCGLAGAGSGGQVRRDRVVVFGAFARAQPATMHAEQVRHFVQPGQGHAALEPVVDVLGRDAALGGEIGRGRGHIRGGGL